MQALARPALPGLMAPAARCPLRGGGAVAGLGEGHSSEAHGPWSSQPTSSRWISLAWSFEAPSRQFQAWAAKKASTWPLSPVPWLQARRLSTVLLADLW
jgi:hypothetical protein